MLISTQGEPLSETCLVSGNCLSMGGSRHRVDEHTFNDPVPDNTLPPLPTSPDLKWSSRLAMHWNPTRQTIAYDWLIVMRV